MAHTFDIRFDRLGGFAGIFEEPANSFRWKGGGLLSIDRNGVNIAVNHGLLSLLARRRAQRIPAGNLKEVYREGKALRVEFATDESAREVLPFWVQDRETAAAIVKLLPTTRTVEMEHSTARGADAKFHLDRRVATIGLVFLLAAGTTTLWFARGRTDPAMPIAAVPEIEVPPVIASPVDLDALPQIEAPETAPAFLEPVPIDVAPPPALPGTLVPPDSANLPLQIPRGTPEFVLAIEQARAFALQAREIETRYREYHKLFIARAITTDEFLSMLDDSEMRWWDFTFRVLEDEAFAAHALVELRAAELSAARHWRNFFGGYAEGIRTRDHVMIAKSFDELTLAEQQRARIHRLAR